MAAHMQRNMAPVDYMETRSSSALHGIRQMAKTNAVTLSTYSFFWSEERRNLNTVHQSFLESPS